MTFLFQGSTDPLPMSSGRRNNPHLPEFSGNDVGVTGPSPDPLGFQNGFHVHGPYCPPLDNAHRDRGAFGRSLSMPELIEMGAVEMRARDLSAVSRRCTWIPRSL